MQFAMIIRVYTCRPSHEWITSWTAHHLYGFLLLLSQALIYVWVERSHKLRTNSLKTNGVNWSHFSSHTSHKAKKIHSQHHQPIIWWSIYIVCCLFLHGDRAIKDFMDAWQPSETKYQKALEKLTAVQYLPELLVNVHMLGVNILWLHYKICTYVNQCLYFNYSTTPNYRSCFTKLQIVFHQTTDCTAQPSRQNYAQHMYKPVTQN